MSWRIGMACITQGYFAELQSASSQYLYVEASSSSYYGNGRLSFTRTISFSSKRSKNAEEQPVVKPVHAKPRKPRSWSSVECRQKPVATAAADWSLSKENKLLPQT